MLWGLKMKLNCSYCGRDLNEIWQDNMSHEPGIVECEDCAQFHKEIEESKEDE